MQIQGFTPDELANYVCHQLNNFFPDKNPVTKKSLEPAFSSALSRTQICINSVRNWKLDHFDPMHSSQYCTFLYYLSNSLWKKEQNTTVCTKIFYLNKALNGFECFYDNNLPEKFFIGHSVGIVLVRNDYKNYLILYQGSTVGRNKDDTPILSERIALYPNSSIIGRCNIASDCIVTPGTQVVNQSTKEKSLILQQDGKLISKPTNSSLFEETFRL